MLHGMREFLRVFFIMGTVLVPILYWLLGIISGHNQGRVQDKKERGTRVDQSESEDHEFWL